MRRRLYEVLDQVRDRDPLASAYAVFTTLVVIINLIPLGFKEETELFILIDVITVIIFIVDYLLRLFTADLKLQKGAASFFIYPFTPLAIFDLLCILPSLHLLGYSFRLFKMFRLVRTLRVLRVFKLARFSSSMRLVSNVFKAQKRPLITVLGLAVAYVLVSALVMFNMEPDTFDSFFDAVYWAVISLTTVGYGDIYPASNVGRLVTMISSLFGIAVIALPSGIITAGFMDELNRRHREAERARANGVQPGREGEISGDH